MPDSSPAATRACTAARSASATRSATSTSGLTYQAGLLEKAGLVTRAPAADDDRGVTVSITDAGRSRLADVFPGHIEVVSRLLFEPLSPEDVTALAELLGPVRDHMRSTPPRSAAPRRRRKADRGGA